MDSYQFLSVESIDDGKIVRVHMNRPEVRNAQNLGLLTELDVALTAAERDPKVRVVILGGLGNSFSSGHDLGSPAAQKEAARFRSEYRAAEARWAREAQYYFDCTRRWRDLSKITIAQVQGYCLAAGLMLAWCCDLITAAENAVFADIAGARMGMCGVEYFAHPWELGARKAKELMLTGDSIDAYEAYRLGMVNKVFPETTLQSDTLAFARRIAELPSFTTLLIKEAVNQAVDAQGFYQALKSAFSLHQLNHAHWAELTRGESAVWSPDPEGGIKKGARSLQPALRSSPGGLTPAKKTTGR